MIRPEKNLKKSLLTGIFVIALLFLAVLFQDIGYSIRFANTSICQENAAVYPYLTGQGGLGWDVSVTIPDFGTQVTTVDGSGNRDIIWSSKLTSGASYTATVTITDPNTKDLTFQVIETRSFVVGPKENLQFIDDARRATNPSDNQLKEKLYGCYSPYTQYREGLACDIENIDIVDIVPSGRGGSPTSEQTLFQNTIYRLNGEYHTYNTIQSKGECIAIVNKPGTTHIADYPIGYSIRTNNRFIIDGGHYYDGAHKSDTYGDGGSINNNPYLNHVLYNTQSKYVSMNNLSLSNIDLFFVRHRKVQPKNHQLTNSFFNRSSTFNESTSYYIAHNNIYTNGLQMRSNLSNTNSYNNTTAIGSLNSLGHDIKTLPSHFINNAYFGYGGVIFKDKQVINNSYFIKSNIINSDIGNFYHYGNIMNIGNNLFSPSLLLGDMPNIETDGALNTGNIATNLLAPSHYAIFPQYLSGKKYHVIYSGNLQQNLTGTIQEIADNNRQPQGHDICISYGDLAQKQAQPYQREEVGTGTKLLPTQIPFDTDKYIGEFNNNRCTDIYPEKLGDFTDIYNVPLNSLIQTQETLTVSDIVEAAYVFTEPTYSAIPISTGTINTGEIQVPMINNIWTDDSSAANSGDEVSLRQQSADTFSTTTTVSYNIGGVQQEWFVQTRPAVIPTLIEIKNISPDPIPVFSSGSNFIFTGNAWSGDTAFATISGSGYSGYTTQMIATGGVWSFVLPDTLSDGEYIIILTAREPGGIDIPGQRQYSFLVNTTPVDTTPAVCTVSKNVSGPTISLNYTSNETAQAVIVCNGIEYVNTSVLSGSYSRSRSFSPGVQNCTLALTDQTGNEPTICYFDAVINGGGGGGGTGTPKDYCPEGDESPSYYDDTCDCTTNCPTDDGGDDDGTDDGTDDGDDGDHGSGDDDLSFDDIINAYLPISTCFYTDVEYGKIMFYDIRYHPYKSSVESLLDFCIVKGTAPSTFNPYMAITNAHFAKIITKITLLGLRSDHDTESIANKEKIFDDLDNTDRSAIYFHKMVDLGRINAGGDINPHSTAETQWIQDVTINALSYAQTQQTIFEVAPLSEAIHMRKTFNSDVVSRGVISYWMDSLFDLRARASHSAVMHMDLWKEIQQEFKLISPTRQRQILLSVKQSIVRFSQESLANIDINKGMFQVEIDAVLNGLSYDKQTKEDILTRVYTQDIGSQTWLNTYRELETNPSTLYIVAPTLSSKGYNGHLVALFLKYAPLMR